MGTTEPLVLTLEVTTMDEGTTLLSPTTSILADMEATAALFPMEGNILPTMQGMGCMDHQGAINMSVSTDRGTPSVVRIL